VSRGPGRVQRAILDLIATPEAMAVRTDALQEFGGLVYPKPPQAPGGAGLWSGPMH
jgi:hypothetical protein